MKISKIITDKYKLRIPPTVYYELLADVLEVEEPTDKNDCETCIHNKGILECDMYGCKYEPTTKNDLAVDWDELKRKILMEVDGGTDDAWLAYGEVCDRISNSIDEFVADMRGNAKRKGEPIEGNNESYNCENWIP